MAYKKSGRGRPLEGIVRMLGKDGASYDVPEGEVNKAEGLGFIVKPSAPRATEGEVRLTVKRIADGIRAKMQNREGFVAVMEAAALTDKAVENLFAWLGAWIEGSRERQAKKLAEEIAADEQRLAEKKKTLQALKAKP